MNQTIGADTEEQLIELERAAQQMHDCGRLDAEGLGYRRSVVAGIRRMYASGREDLARQLLHAWRQHGIDAS